MNNDAGRWLGALKGLNVYRAKGGPAPHKPLLILVLLELAERGQMPAGILPLTPELAFRFSSYWAVVAHRRTQRPDVRLPFHHLQSDGCWSALREDGSPSDGPRSTRYAELNPGFEAVMRDDEFRREARRILISGYFEPGERLALRTLVGLAAESEEGSREDKDAVHRAEVEKARARSVRFRLDVGPPTTTPVP
jgi:putative restriction endonuclease